LKIALAYQRSIGQGTRTRLIGRERAYHGVGFGGISVGGITKNRRSFGELHGVSHIRHTHDPARNAFSKGQPEHGEEFADDLERLVQFHGPETIAACIIEPVSGSTGVLVPPKGYLKRIREICSRYGILLIMDEVITGFGRLGAPFAADLFEVQPDIITTAKALTNGSIPMGAVFVRRSVKNAVVESVDRGIELFHGYTYSGHPVACAAGLATLHIYEREKLFTRAAELSQVWEDAIHQLRTARNVVDIRAIGLMAGIELASRPGDDGARGYEIFVDCLRRGLLIRVTGDTIALSPPLIVEAHQIDEIISILGDAINRAS